MNQICNDLSPNEPVHTHGIALWNVINDEQIPLEGHPGNICCRARHDRCTCEVISRSVDTSTSTNSSTTPSHLIRTLDVPKRERGYLCNTGLNECEIECRKAASKYFDNDEIANIDADVNNQPLDIFNEPNHQTMGAISTCNRLEAINHVEDETSSWSANIYLKYHIGYVQPTEHELFLGEICCEKVRSKLVTPVGCV